MTSHPNATSPRVPCPRCGKSSNHPDDNAEGYCANCHDWTRTPFARRPEWRIALMVGIAYESGRDRRRCPHCNAPNTHVVKWHQGRPLRTYVCAEHARAITEFQSQQGITVASYRYRKTPR